MAFTPRQLRFINVVRRRIPALRDEALWRLVLMQTGCHRTDGVPSLAHPRNSHEAFETIMHRLAMYPESDLDEREWESKTNAAGKRLRRALESFHAECRRMELCGDDALPGFCERMTARRPEYLDAPPTRCVGELEPWELLHVVEGFKAWMRREANKRGVQAPKFGGAA